MCSSDLTPFRGPGQVQNAFTANEDIRPDLTLFDSESSNAVFGNLLTLPIGDAGLLYVEPLYVEGTGDGGFPLLQRGLVNFGGRIGYSNTLAGALDEVFGSGAGEVATDSDGAPDTPEDDGDATPTPTPTPTPDPAPDGGTGESPDVDAALADVDAALDAFADAQQSRNFAAQGQALSDLDAAVQAYREAQAATEGAATPGG